MDCATDYGTQLCDQVKITKTIWAGDGSANWHNNEIINNSKSEFCEHVIITTMSYTKKDDTNWKTKEDIN
eukprot:15962494-Heterocapsa_arctica.AAC.1